MRSKKSQAAIEFLSSYGWALVITLTCLFALTYYITFYPGDYPETCYFETGFFCNDITIKDNIIQLSIRNSFGSIDIYPEVRIENKCTSISQISVNGLTTFPVKVDSEDNFLLRIECADLQKGRISEDIYINYTSIDNKINHTMKGTIIGNIK